MTQVLKYYAELSPATKFRFQGFLVIHLSSGKFVYLQHQVATELPDKTFHLAKANLEEITEFEARELAPLVSKFIDYPDQELPLILR